MTAGGDPTSSRVLDETPTYNLDPSQHAAGEHPSRVKSAVEGLKDAAADIVTGRS